MGLSGAEFFFMEIDDGLCEIFGWFTASTTFRSCYDMEWYLKGELSKLRLIYFLKNVTRCKIDIN